MVVCNFCKNCCVLHDQVSEKNNQNNDNEGEGFIFLFELLCKYIYIIISNTFLYIYIIYTKNFDNLRQSNHQLRQSSTIAYKEDC